MTKCKEDQLTPVLTFILGFAVYHYLCTRLITRLPSTHYLTLEDAYGRSRLLSMDVFGDYSIIKKFLECHYRDMTGTAGEVLVRAGRFHLLLGSRRGNIIQKADWLVTGRIKPGSRIVNSVYIDSDDMKCLQCQVEFIVSKTGEFHWYEILSHLPMLLLTLPVRNAKYTIVTMTPCVMLTSKKIQKC